MLGFSQILKLNRKPHDATISDLTHFFKNPKKLLSKISQVFYHTYFYLVPIRNKITKVLTQYRKKSYGIRFASVTPISKPGDIRLVARFSSASDENGKTLALVRASRVNERFVAVDWRVYTLSMHSHRRRAIVALMLTKGPPRVYTIAVCHDPSAASKIAKIQSSEMVPTSTILH